MIPERHVASHGFYDDTPANDSLHSKNICSPAFCPLLIRSSTCSTRRDRCKFAMPTMVVGVSTFPDLSHAAHSVVVLYKTVPRTSDTPYPNFTTIYFHPAPERRYTPNKYKRRADLQDVSSSLHIHCQKKLLLSRHRLSILSNNTIVSIATTLLYYIPLLL